VSGRDGVELQAGLLASVFRKAQGGLAERRRVQTGDPEGAAACDSVLLVQALEGLQRVALVRHGVPPLHTQRARRFTLQQREAHRSLAEIEACYTNRH
jgi:hypothetical protein